MDFGLGGLTNMIKNLAPASAISNPTSAFASLGGAILSGGANVYSQLETNRQNKNIAKAQMQFQSDMSNTAHQREVADLQAAGLNPILSAGGNGSSTPSGASATMVAPKIEMPDLMAYGISLKQLEQADQRIEIERANSAAAISKTLSDTDLNRMKKVLLNKGMLKAQLEGEASGVMSNIIQYLKDSVRKNPNIQNFKAEFLK